MIKFLIIILQFHWIWLTVCFRIPLKFHSVFIEAHLLNLCMLKLIVSNHQFIVILFVELLNQLFFHFINLKHYFLTILFLIVIFQWLQFLISIRFRILLQFQSVFIRVNSLILCMIKQIVSISCDSYCQTFLFFHFINFKHFHLRM